MNDMYDDEIFDLITSDKKRKEELKEFYVSDTSDQFIGQLEDEDYGILLLHLKDTFSLGVITDIKDINMFDVGMSYKDLCDFETKQFLLLYRMGYKNNKEVKAFIDNNVHHLNFMLEYSIFYDNLVSITQLEDENNLNHNFSQSLLDMYNYSLVLKGKEDDLSINKSSSAKKIALGVSEKVTNYFQTNDSFDQKSIDNFRMETIRMLQDKEHNCLKKARNKLVIIFFTFLENLIPCLKKCITGSWTHRTAGASNRKEVEQSFLPFLLHTGKQLEQYEIGLIN